MKQLDNLTRIRNLIRKLNQKHPEYLGLIKVRIYDDCSGGFDGGEEQREFEGFSSLVELKKLFKKYGV